MESLWKTQQGENWMVEEGIGHFDPSGIFEYGEPPYGWSEYGCPEEEVELEALMDETGFEQSAECTQTVSANQSDPSAVPPGNSPHRRWILVIGGLAAAATSIAGFFFFRNSLVLQSGRWLGRERTSARVKSFAGSVLKARQDGRI